MGSAFLDALLVTDPMFDCFVIILVKHAMGLHIGEKKNKSYFRMVGGLWELQDKEKPTFLSSLFSLEASHQSFLVSNTGVCK